MTEVLVTACRTLDDPAATPALRAVAAEALLLAANEGLSVPMKAPWLVWSWLKTIPANRSWR